MLSENSMRTISDYLKKSIDHLEYEIEDKVISIEHFEDCLLDDAEETNPNNKYSECDINIIKDTIIEDKKKLKCLLSQLSSLVKCYNEFIKENKILEFSINNIWENEGA